MVGQALAEEREDILLGPAGGGAARGLARAATEEAS